MKTTIRFLLCIVGIWFLTTMSLSAQGKPLVPNEFPKRAFTPYLLGQPPSDGAARYRIPGTKASQYTAEDWGRLIDSTWGPGQTAAEQLAVFDMFWNSIDQQWAGFPNLSLNWDSVRTVYRPQIGTGLSRGRFYALMSRLWLPLMEYHTAVTDLKVDAVFGSSSVNYKYRPGVPLLIVGSWTPDLLGAAVTPLPDSTNVVYRVAPGNPLGLEPGDLVLGYEGVPWKHLCHQLLDAGLPVSYHYSNPGSTPESMTSALLTCVGYNWGLFDTIDVVKYSTGDTLHLPTAPLATLSQTVWATDQVSIAGVPMPQGAVNGTAAVSWGVVQGTNVGYIYVWDWYTPSTPQLFHDAIYDLRYNKKVDGLVIDFRTNYGGVHAYANLGLSQLFGFDPTGMLSIATRNSVSNHMGFTTSASSGGFTPTPDPFDRPIAVLIGPACWSSGDYNAFRLRFHPMARYFGKPTNGAFVAGSGVEGTFSDAWWYRLPTSCWYSNVPGEGYLMHKGLQPDEEVWLTREGVAKGQDDVVKRAIEWITTLAYAHNVQLSRQGTDTVCLAANVENPLAHSLKVVVTYKDTSGTIADSSLMYNDGLHGDGAPGDSVWGWLYLPTVESVYHLSVRTDDLTAGTSRTLPDVAQFVYTQKALLSMDTRTVELGNIYHALSRFDTTFQVSNLGWAEDSIYVSLDPIVTPDSAISVSPIAFALAPGGSQTVTFSVMPHWLSKGVNYNAVVMVDSRFGFGQTHFEKTFAFAITAVSEEPSLPRAFALDQNYPNPFNPSTTIRYELPHASRVSLKVYNTLGQEVATLVNESKPAGVFTVTFDAGSLASGVYFYRLVAGRYGETRKMLLMR